MAASDQTFLTLIREIEWGKLTAAEAVELRTALRDAVTKSEAWFAQLASGFGAVPKKIAVATVAAQDAPPPVSAPRRRGRPPKRVAVAVTEPPRKRGRPPKAAQPVEVALSAQEHPPIGVLAGSYVSHAPDPSRISALPPGHPRAGGNPMDYGADADFVAASREMPKFN